MSNCSEAETLNPRGDDALVSWICIGTSCFSMFVNMAVAFTWLRYKELRNPFAYLSVSLAVADCGVLAVFLFMVAPTTLYQDHDWAFKWPGHISLTFWFASLYSMLAIAINRFVAITWPTRYQQIFSGKNTRKVIVGVWLLTVLHHGLYYLPKCHFIYDPNSYGWHYQEGWCYNPMLFVDLIYGLIFVVILFLINVVTGINLRGYNKVIKKSKVAGAQKTREEKEAAKRYKREVRFFLQALCNAVMFEFLLLSFHVISKFISCRFTMFVATSWMWQVSHGTNGFLIIIFNGQIRRRLICCATKVQPTMVGGTSGKSGGPTGNEK